MEIPSGTLPANDAPRRSDAALKQAAQELEATFLAEMLKSAGLGKQGAGAFGGVGEDQFASFLVQAHADQMVKSGGIGLAEAIFKALQERQNGS